MVPRGLVAAASYGQVKQAMDLIAETIVTVDVAADDKSPIAATARKVTRLLGDGLATSPTAAGLVIKYCLASR